MTSSVRVRRSPCLVTYWENGMHQVYNYATQTTHPGDARVVEILDLASRWTSRECLQRALPAWAPEAVDRTVDDLVAQGVLEATDRPPCDAALALYRWGNWNPVAAFFHRVTHALPPATPEATRARWRRVLVERDYPPVTKEYAGRPQIELPTDFGAGPFAEVLRQRRSWREFGNRELTLPEISTLLGLTFGVQQWMHLGGERWVAMKTSPSGGARHSIEAYLLAFKVEGLEPGTYHYAPDTHALTALDSPTPQALLKQFVPSQTGFHDCPALIVMTSVFARMQWKYDFPLAYRVILLDAGHLGQTFALVATSLGLAPFCTAAIDGPGIEQHLGIDGIDESVLFAVGVGPRPAGKSWAPSHDRSGVPHTAPPAWAGREPDGRRT
jgi:SagB-type dehydrogenase family enzyme